MTPAKREAGVGGVFIMNPVSFSAKVPFRVALEHPLSTAFAVGAMLKASVANAAMIKALPMVIGFIIVSFFISS